MDIDHKRIVKSRDPEAIVSPFGEQPNESMQLVCPIRMNTSSGKSESDHIITVLSADPEANIAPSGEKQTEYTLSPCPVRVCSHSPVSNDQILMVQSSKVGASRREASGVNRAGMS